MADPKGGAQRTAPQGAPATGAAREARSGHEVAARLESAEPKPIKAAAGDAAQPAKAQSAEARHPAVAAPSAAPAAPQRGEGGRKESGGAAEGGKPGKEAPKPQPKPAAPFKKVKPPLYERAGALLFYAASALVIYIGWLASDAEWIVPDKGAGYNIGIIGGGAMLLLLAYPLRKKWRRMRNWGAIKWWFRIHMAFGVIGPVLVLYHANFSLGALNSNVVLISTLVVAGSGFIGRYLHAKVHEGLYGRQLSLAGLKKDVEANMTKSETAMAFAPMVQKRLIAFDQDVLRPRNTVLEKMRNLVVISLKIRGLRNSLLKEAAAELAAAAKREHWTPAEARMRESLVREHVVSHVDTAAAVAGFGFFERMLSAWHLFHFPLFIMLVISGIVHVVAVHLF